MAEFGKWYKWSYLFRFMWLRYFTNDEINLFAKRLKSMSDDNYYKILTSKLTPYIIFRLFTPKLALKVIKNMIIYYILEPLKITKIKRRPRILKNE